MSRELFLSMAAITPFGMIDAIMFIILKKNIFASNPAILIKASIQV